MLKGWGLGEFRKELRALMILNNSRSILTQLTLSKPLLSFNFVVLVLVSLTLTPGGVSAGFAVGLKTIRLVSHITS
jgi:hypothetical protein